MNENENIPNMNTAVGESVVLTAAPVADGQAELRQWLSDKVVHDAQELATRINKEAELESARLIKAVIWQAQESINKAQRQVDAAAGLEERPSVKVQDDIAKHTMGVVATILDELLSSMDYLAEKAKALVVMNAKTLEEELRADTNVIGDEATSKVCTKQKVVAFIGEAVSELHSDLKDVIGAVATSEFERRTGETGLAVEVETAATSAPKFAPEALELFYGKVNIEIAPPVNTMCLLGLIRGLENTRGIRILGTSGSRNSGSVIAVSMDKPLPLLSFLSDMPFVEGFKAEDQPVPCSAPEQNVVRRVSVTTGDRPKCAIGK